MQSVFDVGGQSVTEQYGRIIFPNTQAVANSSVEATGTAVGPMPTGSTQPFAGAATKPRCNLGMLVAVLYAFVFVVPW